MCGWSGSTLGVVPFLPALRRERSASKSCSQRVMPAGTPSNTTPIELPCDSPKMESLNLVPKEFILLPNNLYILLKNLKEGWEGFVYTLYLINIYRILYEERCNCCAHCNAVVVIAPYLTS